MKKNYASVILLFLACWLPQGIALRAQSVGHTGEHCGTDGIYQTQLQQSVTFRSLESQIERAYQQRLQQLAAHPHARTSGSVRTIPVVVHVIQTSDQVLVTDARIQSQIDVLNEDFRLLNADTSNIPAEHRPVAADTEIEFCLATIDPDGCPTNGIVRIVSASLANHDMDDAAQLKGLSQWDPYSYLNIWVPVNIQGGTLGYATFPINLNFAPSQDGVVVASQYFGRGAGVPPSAFNLGRTTTHEVGHWLGLFHTFQNGCAGTTAATCTTGGDLVCDTPPTANSNFGCPNTQNTCTETPTDFNDQTINYMD
ncbi:MAG: zinc metalloprotease, partial [Bacteroidota bacterium]